MATPSHRQVMRAYFDRSRTVAANWRARELAALNAIEHHRLHPATDNGRPNYTADNFLRFVFVTMAHQARAKARAAGWRIPA